MRGTAQPEFKFDGVDFRRCQDQILGMAASVRLDSLTSLNYMLLAHFRMLIAKRRHLMEHLQNQETWTSTG
jgi:hypothetical protein